MDDIDFQILNTLMHQARISWTDLAHQVSLSTPGLLDRMRRLEQKGVLVSYETRLDPQLLGYHVSAFLGISITKPLQRKAFIKKVKQIPEVQECHHTSGEEDFLLKIRCRDLSELDKLIHQNLLLLNGVMKTRLTIITQTEKETLSLPPLTHS
jgi:Lrp/AsnC family leucine-responsive transcriptional regulator